MAVPRLQNRSRKISGLWDWSELSREILDQHTFRDLQR